VTFLKGVKIARKLSIILDITLNPEKYFKNYNNCILFALRNKKKIRSKHFNLCSGPMKKFKIRGC